MKVTFLIDDNDSQTRGLRDDINAFLHHYTRAGSYVREEDATEEPEAEDELEQVRRTLLTVEFDNSMDAIDFLNWRDIRRHVRCA